MVDRSAAVGDACVGGLNEFAIGEIKVVQVGRLAIGILRASEDLDAIYAILNACPHRGAPVCMGDLGGTMLPSASGELEYGMERQILRCPWHGYEFDVRTGDMAFTDKRLRLRTFPVSVQDGMIHVTTPGRPEPTPDRP
jgi:nitrite reductase (NADH) small subunit